MRRGLATGSIHDRVMVFIDLRNVMAAPNVKRRKADGWEPDLVSMVETLVEGRRLDGAYAFDTLHRHEDGYVSGLNLVRALRHAGFRVIAPTDEPEDTSEQKEADVMLATELLMQSFHDSYDTAIVVSGDRDFVPAIEAVQSMGRRVEIAAFRGTYTPKLLEVADQFHVLDDVGFLRPGGSAPTPEAPEAGGGA